MNNNKILQSKRYYEEIDPINKSLSSNNHKELESQTDIQQTEFQLLNKTIQNFENDAIKIQIEQEKFNKLENQKKEKIDFKQPYNNAIKIIRNNLQQIKKIPMITKNVPNIDQQKQELNFKIFNEFQEQQSNDNYDLEENLIQNAKNNVCNRFIKKDFYKNEIQRDDQEGPNDNDQQSKNKNSFTIFVKPNSKNSCMRCIDLKKGLIFLGILSLAYSTYQLNFILDFILVGWYFSGSFGVFFFTSIYIIFGIPTFYSAYLYQQWLQKDSLQRRQKLCLAFKIYLISFSVQNIWVITGSIMILGKFIFATQVNFWNDYNDQIEHLYLLLASWALQIGILLYLIKITHYFASQIQQYDSLKLAQEFSTLDKQI